MYRNFSMIIFIYLAMTLMSCSKKPLHKSKALESMAERPEAGTIEWIDRMQYDSKNNISYGYFNDTNDLMIRVMVTDQSTITKIFAAGFTIHIDTTGKKNPQFSIKYPLAQGMQNMPRPGERKNNDDALNAKARPANDLTSRLKTALNQIELLGFKEEQINSTILNSRRGEGICAWIFVDDNQTMYYELKIPLQYISNAGFVPGKMISLGFESGKIDVPSGGPQANVSMRPSGGGGGARSGGGGRPQGGGDRAGMGNQQGKTEMQSLSKPIKIWIKRIELN